ncbi:hypothetical protein ACVR0S_02455 [Streptococcus dentapri]|uniref:ABC transporter permease n=1 Tax=Streptococcus dentapri TaxID=573564 RepID=A0ABV8D0E2_9STRE
MLAKLFKYEFKTIGNWYLAINALILLFSLITAVFTAMLPFKPGELTLNLLVLAGLALITGQFLATLILIIRRFYTNLLGREGYLTLTLPVTCHQLIISKLLVASILTIVNYLILAIGGLIIWSGLKFNPSLLHTITITSDFNNILYFLSYFFIGTISSILDIYLAIAIGQLFRNHRISMAIVSYIIITALIFIMEPIFGLNNPSPDIDSNMPKLLAIDILFSIINYSGTHYIIKNKLDIQ